MQLIILWIGLGGDIVTKGSLTFQLIRLAIRHTWVNFGVILGAYIISSCFVRPAVDAKCHHVLSPWLLHVIQLHAAGPT